MTGKYRSAPTSQAGASGCSSAPETSTATPAGRNPRRKHRSRRRRNLLIGGLLFLCAAPWIGGWWSLQRGRAALQRRDHAVALDWLRRADRLPGRTAEVDYQLARVHRRLGDFEQAAASLEQAEQAGWRTGDLRRERLLLAAQLGQYDRVAGAWEELFRTSRDDGPELSESYVRWCLSRFQIDAARACLDAWQQDFPEDYRPHILRAEIFEVLYDRTSAIEEYRLALELAPERSKLQCRLGRALMQVRQFAEAARLLEQGVEVESPDTPAVLALARCRRHLGQVDEARGHLERQLQMRPDDVAVLAALGELALVEGDPRRAKRLLERGVKLRPEDQTVRYALARTLVRLGETEAAAEHLDFVKEATGPLLELEGLIGGLVHDPDSIERRLRIAEITWKYKSREEGAAWWNSVLVADPANQRAHLGLARHYEVIDQPERAERHRRILNKPGRRL